MMHLQVRMNDSFSDDDALDKKVDELEKALLKLLPEKEDLLRQDAAMSSSRHKFSKRPLYTDFVWEMYQGPEF